jgi:AraC-like DNA-binding protein
MSIAATLVDGADVDFHRPPEALRPYVGCFWIIRAHRGAVLRFVPDGYSSIACELARGRPAEWFLRGPSLGPSQRRFTAPSLLVGVRLRPGVPHLLTGQPVDRMVDRRLRVTRTAWARPLADSDVGREPEEVLRSLVTFLADRLTGARVHPVVEAAIDRIRATRGQAPIAGVAAACGVSPRHLTRVMRAWTGVPPKAFARIVRFQSTLTEIADAPTQPLAAVAAANGYFDQAHLTGDVARLAAATPTRIIRESVAEFSKTRCE